MRPIVPLALALAFLPGHARAASIQQPETAPTESAGYHFLVARHLEDAGRIDEAIAELQKALELEPRSAEIRAELATVYARQNRAVEAIDTAEAALKYDPDNREANRLLGSIYSALADQKRPIRAGDDPAQYGAKAIAALERARRPDLADLGLDFTLGRLYLREGQNEKAIEALQRVFTQQPEYSEGGVLLAAAQEAAGEPDAAIGTLEETIKHNPAFFRAYVPLIDLYERQQRWKDAAGAYALAAAVNPRANLTEGRAAALLNSGAPEEAQSLLQDALTKATKPEASLLYLMAESQRQLKQYAAAEATVTQLRTAFPDDVRGVLMEAQLQLAQGKRSEAVATFADLVKRFPNQPTLAYQYAQLLDEADRHDEAEQVLRDLLAKNPLDAVALNSLGYMFAERGERLDEAVQLLQRALKVEPGNPSYLDSLGWAYFKQGNLASADAPLTEAAAKMPENSVIQDHLGDLRFRQERFADAIVCWERALKGDGESIDRAVIERKLRDARSRVAKR
ncbi:MAG TPA: tetratricopeptide repeat protein [Vicinamibacterales bacterium]